MLAFILNNHSERLFTLASRVFFKDIAYPFEDSRPVYILWKVKHAFRLDK